MTFTDNKLSVSRKQKEPLQLLSALNGAVPVTGKITDTEDKRQRIFAGYNNHPENWNQKKQENKKLGEIWKKAVPILRVCTDGKVNKLMEENKFYGDTPHHQDQTAYFGGSHTWRTDICLWRFLWSGFYCSCHG